MKRIRTFFLFFLCVLSLSAQGEFLLQPVQLEFPGEAQIIASGVRGSDIAVTVFKYTGEGEISFEISLWVIKGNPPKAGSNQGRIWGKYQL